MRCSMRAIGVFTFRRQLPPHDVFADPDTCSLCYRHCIDMICLSAPPRLRGIWVRDGCHVVGLKPHGAPQQPAATACQLSTHRAGAATDSILIYTYVYVYIYIYICICIYAWRIASLVCSYHSTAEICRSASDDYRHSSLWGFLLLCFLVCGIFAFLLKFYYVRSVALAGHRQGAADCPSLGSHART